jgi:hypothetical protein
VNQELMREDISTYDGMTDAGFRSRAAAMLADPEWIANVRRNAVLHPASCMRAAALFETMARDMAAASATPAISAELRAGLLESSGQCSEAAALIRGARGEPN